MPPHKFKGEQVILLFGKPRVEKRTGDVALVYVDCHAVTTIGPAERFENQYPFKAIPIELSDRQLAKARKYAIELANAHMNQFGLIAINSKKSFHESALVSAFYFRTKKNKK